MIDIDYQRLLSIIGLSINYAWIDLHKTINKKTFFFQEVCIVADHVKQTCKFHAIFYGPPLLAAASKLWNTSSPCLVLGSEVLVSSPRSVQ